VTGPELAQYRGEGEGQGRAYRHPLSGVTVPSVTTALKAAAKDGIPQWAASLTLRWAHENRDALFNRDLADFVAGGKYQWTKVRDERAFVGTEIHEYIEADLRDSWDMPQPWDTEVLDMVAEWRKFRAEHSIVPHHIESTVWSHEHGYAGTFDWLGELDGVLCLADNKSSKSLWPEHEMQLAALAKADVLMVKAADGTWSELPMPKVQGYAFIHIRPRYLDPLMRIDEQAFCRVEYLDPADVDDRFSQFLGYLQAWKAEQAVKQRRKERGK
jgi:hypothetical protein